MCVSSAWSFNLIDAGLIYCRYIFRSFAIQLCLMVPCRYYSRRVEGRSCNESPLFAARLFTEKVDKWSPCVCKRASGILLQNITLYNGIFLSRTVMVRIASWQLRWTYRYYACCRGVKTLICTIFAHEFKWVECTVSGDIWNDSK